jgi:hypothetical protein
MKLLIQLNFQNGLGNFYTAITQIIHFVEYYKSLGYECNFVFSSKSSNLGGNGWGIDLIKIDEILDTSTLSIFNSVENLEYSINTKVYNEYTYYGGGSPGNTWWDVFFIEPPQNFKSFGYGVHDGNIFGNRDHIPNQKPKFNNKIISKVDYFKNNFPKMDYAIQLRLYGYGDQNNFSPSLVEQYEQISEKIKLSSKNYFLTSSCVSCLPQIYKLPNVFLFHTRDNSFMGDTTDFINREVRLDFLENSIAEMVLLAEFDTIYHKTVLPWTSTFLYYSFVNNPKLEIESTINL